MKPLLEEPQAPERTRQKERKISSQQLFAGEREIFIEHGKDVYRLQITNSNKLILNK